MTLTDVSLLAAAVGMWTMLCLYLGFAAGRMTIDKPMSSPVQPKPGRPAAEQDPYYEPMHGRPQPGIPTIGE